ncbi:MarR family winged helix-turn-helix transcriptional regulator [Vibrio scophthalmi]|uniref:Putative transcriptional regulator n=1 Tax=Vibrio scophthalmi LMG 19158 TaxID=870967 RepID=F9RS44_9VIBR|nr:MarR family winged helix-turn-helix transcriptional regulator [Vibrio scophthalmi]EGU32548.1 putative transcriptional regulator [Vibrio scophthalmi LMG 19158]
MASNHEAYELLERIGNLLRNEARQMGNEHGLHPVHIEMLYYLQRCNLFSDTPAALTEFLGITKGTASQSITLLESKGLLSKNKDLNDKRISHLKLTEQGETLIHQICPPARFIPLLEKVENDSPHVIMVLKQLLSDMQQGNDKASFGVCKTCRHHEVRSETEFFCQLTQMTLAREFGELICKEHDEEFTDKKD